MRKSLLVVSVFLLSCVFAGGAALKPNFPWDCPSAKGNIANSTINSGFYIDCVAAGCVIGAAPAMAVSFGLGRILLDVAGLASTIGGRVMDKGVETRYATLKKAGYKIPVANRNKSKKLLLGTLILEAGGLGLEVANLAVGGSTGLAIGSLVCVSLATVVEAIDIAGPRVEWIKDINQAVSGKRQKSLALADDPVTVSPILTAAYDRPKSRWNTAIGFGVSIAY